MIRRTAIALQLAFRVNHTLVTMLNSFCVRYTSLESKLWSLVMTQPKELLPTMICHYVGLRLNMWFTKICTLPNAFFQISSTSLTLLWWTRIGRSRSPWLCWVSWGFNTFICPTKDHHQAYHAHQEPLVEHQEVEEELVVQEAETLEEAVEPEVQWGWSEWTTRSLTPCSSPFMTWWQLPAGCSKPRLLIASCFHCHHPK